MVPSWLWEIVNWHCCSGTLQLIYELNWDSCTQDWSKALHSPNNLRYFLGLVAFWIHHLILLHTSQSNSLQGKILFVSNGCSGSLELGTKKKNDHLLLTCFKNNINNHFTFQEAARYCLGLKNFHANQQKTLPNERTYQLRTLSFCDNVWTQ